MKQENASLRDLASQLMIRFHCDYARGEVFTNIPAQEHVSILGQLGIEVGRCLLGKEGSSLSLQSVTKIAGKHEGIIRKKLPPKVLRGLPSALAEGTASEEADSKTALAPRIIRFGGDGKAVNEQEAVPEVDKKTLIAITTVSKNNDVMLERLRVACYHALYTCWDMYCVGGDALVKVQGNPSKVSTWKVLSVSNTVAGSLVILPLVPSSSSIGLDSLHPNRVPTSVRMPEGKELCISPSLRTCSSSSTAADAKGWIQPFWVMTRSANRVVCNCEMTHIVVNTVCSGGAGLPPFALKEPRALSDGEMTVPCCSNFKELAENEELVLHWNPQSQDKAKEKRGRTWMQDAMAAEKNQGAPGQSAKRGR